MATVRKRRRKIGVDSNEQPIYRLEGWQVRYVDPDGDEKSKSFRLKADADRFSVEVEHRKLSGLYVDPAIGRVTFKDYAESWRAAQPHRRSTAEQVESRLRLHVYPFIGDRPIASIRPTELQALVRDRAEHLAASSLENVAVWVQTIFRAAVADRIIVVSPATGLRLPAGPERPQVVPFEVDQIEALAAALPNRLRAAVALGVGAGLRSGEVLGLALDRVDFLRRVVSVDQQLFTPSEGPPVLVPPKTRASRRVIPLGDVVLEALAAHVAAHRLGDDGLLFTDDRRRPIRRNRWGEIWADAVAAAGLPKGTRYHQLRHTYASLLIRAGCSVKVVQARLGHATAQETLETYAHLWPDDDDRTRAAVDEALRHGSDQDRTITAAQPL